MEEESHSIKGKERRSEYTFIENGRVFFNKKYSREKQKALFLAKVLLSSVYICIIELF
jgi:hypothetical protein